MRFVVKKKYNGSQLHIISQIENMNHMFITFLAVIGAEKLVNRPREYGDREGDVWVD